MREKRLFLFFSLHARGLFGDAAIGVVKDIVLEWRERCAGEVLAVRQHTARLERAMKLTVSCLVRVALNANNEFDGASFVTDNFEQLALSVAGVNVATQKLCILHLLFIATNCKRCRHLVRTLIK